LARIKRDVSLQVAGIATDHASHDVGALKVERGIRLGKVEKIAHEDRLCFDLFQPHELEQKACVFFFQGLVALSQIAQIAGCLA
jgi:hypothetical protein